MAFDVKDKVVLVTGANRGIGRAILDEALQRDATKVYAAVRDVSSAEPLVAEYGQRVVPVHLELNDPESIAAAAQAAQDVDVVVNNAGVLTVTPALDAGAIEALQSEMNVNVYGLLRVARAFAPLLKANGGGALVQLNSVASVKTFPDFATYSASKAASYAITQALRESLQGQATQVVSVHPGPIRTDMGVAAGFEDMGDSPAVVATAIFDAIAAGRFHVWPDEVARQIGGVYQSFGQNVVEADMQENPA